MISAVNIAKSCTERTRDSTWDSDTPRNGWKFTRLKWVVSKIGSGKTPRGGGETYSSSGILFLRSQNVHFAGLRLDDVVYIDEAIDREMETTRVQPDDVLLNITGASLARCCLVPQELPPANVNQHVCILRPRSDLIRPAFLHAVISSHGVQSQIFSSENGVSREGLNYTQTANLMFAVPQSIEMQQRIVNFLNRETAKIDALIAKKQRLIELLQEKRTALISHAVTKGLDPGMPMKDSGEPWIGKIPAHWLVKCFGWVSYVVRGASPRPAGDPSLFNGDFIPWITVAEVTKDRSKYLTETETMLTEAGMLASRVLDEGTLVLTNSGATLGVPKILLIRGCANDGIVAFLRLAPECNQDFAYYYLFSLTSMLRDRIKQGCGQPNLNTDIIKSTPIVLPPLCEQAEIAAYIESIVAKLDLLIARVEKGIEKLREYRTALISAAVTGKIDVRGEAE